VGVRRRHGLRRTRHDRADICGRRAQRAALGTPSLAAAAIDGEQGAILRLIGLTALRGCFIFPGLWIVNKVTKAELDALKLLALSFGGSATITLGMVAYYLVQRRVLQWRSQTALPVV
jgi:hypothetical protein